LPIDALLDVFFKPYEGPEALIITRAGNHRPLPALSAIIGG